MCKSLRLLILAVLLCSALVLAAQEHTISLAKAIDKDSVTSRNHISMYDKHVQFDLIDLGVNALKKIGSHSLDTILQRSQKLHSALLPGIGYSLQTKFAAELNYVGGFYTTPSNKNSNQSSINATVIYTQLNQLLIPVVTNIWTKDDNYNIQTDWRFLIFPQNTYGLGNSTSLSDGYIINFSDLRLYSTIYKPVLKDMYLGIGYSFDYFWNVEELHPPNQPTDFERYNTLNHLSGSNSYSSAPTINFLYDTRRNSINPEKGNYVNISYRINESFIGSSTNWQSLVVDLRKYIRVSSQSPNLFAFWAYEWLTLNGAPPYLLLPYSAGDPLNNTGRGFAEGRLRGKDMLYLESEFRFRITQNGLLGGVLFSNINSYSDLNNHFNGINAGYGAGIRIKINKFSRTNAAFDYAFGTDGTRGIFLNLGEVF